ncbi:MAG: 16S rRNA (cytosine(967)-C(5))-methyltransferase RsmB [Porticoccaceae bacterium]|nr:16S rRNA (cytosine(967)-C(5))-methyltransferase RsmB [Porticoccaceae bacterium]
MKAREACARVLAGVLRQEGSLNTLLPAALERVTASDRALVQELCYGTLRWYPALERLLGALIDRPLKAKDAEITMLLAAGLYQLRHMRTPDHAAVNETVAACQALKRPWAKGLANGVLRRFLRERDSLEARFATDPQFTTAHPTWLRKALESAWPEQATALFAANNTRPPMVLRVNTRHGDRDNYLIQLADAGIGAHAAPLTPTAIYLDEPQAVDLLPDFSVGAVSVQDEAAQLCAQLLAPAPGERALDACSAPGGKACHLLEQQPALAELVALDVDGERLQRVADNLDRLGLCATLKAADAATLSSWWDGRLFDRILLDAPCSASGVIRRHPDIKLLRQSADIGRLAATQLALLTALWAVLKPGGQLLYATCSVLPAENDAVVSAFTEHHPEARLLPIDVSWGIATSCGRQLLPTPGGPDGFYYALLEKVLPEQEAALS